MTVFTYHISGKFIKSKIDWMYVGGNKNKDEVDSDLMSYFVVLDKCKELGYVNVKKLWYADDIRSQSCLKDSLHVLDSDITSGFIDYILNHVTVNIYVEHGNVTNPHFGDENPKERCDKLGISDHGAWMDVGVAAATTGDVGAGFAHDIEVDADNGVAADLGVETDVVDLGIDKDVDVAAALQFEEFDGYLTGHGSSEYEDDEYEDENENERDHKQIVDDYWMENCPYLSDDDDEELMAYREKKRKFKFRKKKIGKEKFGATGGPSDVGVVGPKGATGPNVDVVGPSRENVRSELPRSSVSDAALGQRSEREDDFVEEIRREMNRREGLRRPQIPLADEENLEVSTDSDAEGSYLTSSSDSQTDEIRRVALRRPRFSKDDINPRYAIGMVFPNKSEFKKSVERYAIYNRRNIICSKNDAIRCRVVCNTGSCSWILLCTVKNKFKQWMITTYRSQHTCQPQFRISCLTYHSIARWFLTYVRKLTLKLTVAEMMEHFSNKTKIKVSRCQCLHAREKVVNHYMGDPDKEFARLEDYVEELKVSNPGSTIVMEHKDGIFKQMYVCFDGVRKGFNSACRKVIGLDGCFLKGPFRGEILTAVGRDANDQMYPIAWAVVGYECKESWRWFLELLMIDLEVSGRDCVYGNDGTPQIARGTGFTFISDQQKGLIAALGELMPAAVHRRCARHIFAKWRKDHKGADLHQQFWITAKATTRRDFTDHLEILKGISADAQTDFMSVPPQHWCRAFQSISCCSDVIDNNMSESFNSMILESRYKSIVRLFETIRKAVFKRFKERKDFMRRFKDGLGPKIWKKLNKIRKTISKFYVDSNGHDGYEVHLDDEIKWVVSLDRKTCTCRKWELTGLPCAHAYCVIENEFEEPDITEYVSPWYKLPMFALAYNTPILPVNGKQFWPRVATTTIKPPAFKKFPGRPSKLRKKESWEPSQSGTNLSRLGTPMTCTICHIEGHNSATCKDNPVNKEKQVVPPSVIDLAKARSRKHAKCGYCKNEGHKRNTCSLNPMSKNFISASQVSQMSTTQCSQTAPLQQPQTPLSLTQPSQPSISSAAMHATQLQELRQEFGTGPSKVGRKKLSNGTTKVPYGGGLFVAKSGWSCLNPKTPQQQVVSVPSKKKKQAPSKVCPAPRPPPSSRQSARASQAPKPAPSARSSEVLKAAHSAIPFKPPRAAAIRTAQTLQTTSSAQTIPTTSSAQTLPTTSSAQSSKTVLPTRSAQSYKGSSLSDPSPKGLSQNTTPRKRLAVSADNAESTKRRSTLATHAPKLVDPNDIPIKGQVWMP